MVTIALSRTVSELNGDFCRKSHIFPTLVYLTLPLREYPLEFYNGDSAEKRLCPYPKGRKEVRLDEVYIYKLITV